MVYNIDMARSRYYFTQDSTNSITVYDANNEEWLMRLMIYVGDGEITNEDTERVVQLIQLLNGDKRIEDLPLLYVDSKQE